MNGTTHIRDLVVKGRMMKQKSILVVIGTRPEAIKMAPVINAMELEPDILCKVCVTGQHEEMLDQVLSIFGIKPDFNLRLMHTSTNIETMLSGIITGVGEIIKSKKPQLILVHGDTTTTLGATLAAFYNKVPVGHIEAGLRSGDLSSPWPEEMNRRFASLASNIHFAPTEDAKQTLLNENVDAKNILVTGNTVIDALLSAVNKIKAHTFPFGLHNTYLSSLDLDKKIILVTCHRRENFGLNLDNICRAVRTISQDVSEVEIVWPVHPNPAIKNSVEKYFGNTRNVNLIKPLDYLSFVQVLQKTTLILTDSGGLQEEGPALNIPVLLMRNTTERPEALSTGAVKQVGTSYDGIVQSVKHLLTSDIDYNRMADAKNPFGDGSASQKIVNFILEHLNE